MRFGIKRTTTLEELGEGCLFMHNGVLAIKTAYRTKQGSIKSYMAGTGEMFWGGTHNAADLGALTVLEVELLKTPAYEH